MVVASILFSRSAHSANQVIGRGLQVTMAFFVSWYNPLNIFESSSKDCSAFLFHGEILIRAMASGQQHTQKVADTKVRSRGYLDGKCLRNGKTSTRFAPGNTARVRRVVKSLSLAMVGSLSERIWGLP